MEHLEARGESVQIRGFSTFRVSSQRSDTDVCYRKMMSQ